MKLNVIKNCMKMAVKLAIYAFAFFIFLPAFAHLSNGQELSKTKLNFSAEKATLLEIFEFIEKQTPYRFVYDTQVSNATTTFTYQLGETTLKNALDVLSKDGDLTFNVLNRSISVTKNPTTQQGAILQTVVSGKITDENGVPLPGATVLIKGRTTGTTTDFDGKFSLNAKRGDILVISYVGYTAQELQINNEIDNISVSLQPEASQLDEVVLIGYGSVRKGDLSTAVAVVDSEDLANQVTTGFDQAITGKVAGVQVLQTSGSPGGNVSIRVRGTASINADNDPLYVIDGVPLSNDTKFAGGNTSEYETPTNPLNSINTNDIESIQILKDAAATAIYGSRGSNGVVLITTKKGKVGKLKVSYNTNFGVQTVTKKIDLLDAYQYSQLAREARNNTYQDFLNQNSLSGSSSDSNAVRTANGAPTHALIPHQILPYLNGQSGLTDTDWQDEIFRHALI